ncbi:MAG: hypothetical protein JO075_09850, partial [Acidimicrobiia bacterium]|nr:hypothetical protein [Acidimicrobiia bacterium]
ELMVVVLIIAILIAIAIPTFLGARQRAQDRAAQSNARNALTAEKTSFTDAQTYTSSATVLSGIEPSLNFVADEVPGHAALNNEVAVSISGTNVVIGVLSKSGTCFYLEDDAASPGTQYYKSASCPATNSMGSPAWTSSW